MNKKYDSLFKELMSSYYSEDNFDEKLNDIDKNSDNIAYDIRKAITAHKKSKKI